MHRMSVLNTYVKSKIIIVYLSAYIIPTQAPIDFILRWSMKKKIKVRIRKIAQIYFLVIDFLRIL